MDALMLQGLGTHRSEVAANSQIHVNSRIGEARFKAVLQYETAADPRKRNWSVQETDRYRPQLEKYVALYFPLLQEFCEITVDDSRLKPLPQ